MLSTLLLSAGFALHERAWVKGAWDGAREVEAMAPGGGKGRGGGVSEGMSWNEEREQWERKHGGASGAGRAELLDGHSDERANDANRRGKRRNGANGRGYDDRGRGYDRYDDHRRHDYYRARRRYDRGDDRRRHYRYLPLQQKLWVPCHQPLQPNLLFYQPSTPRCYSCRPHSRRRSQTPCRLRWRSDTSSGSLLDIPRPPCAAYSAKRRWSARASGQAAVPASERLLLNRNCICLCLDLY